MNKIVLLIVFLFSSSISNSQNSYSIVFEALGTDDYPGEMIENSMGDLFIVGLKREYTNQERAVVWKIDSEGDTISRVFNYNDTSSSLFTILPENDGTVSAFGYIDNEQNSPNSSILMLRLDSILNVVSERIIEIPGFNKVVIERSFSTSSNYFLAGLGTDYFNISKLLLIKLDDQYNLISQQSFFQNENYNGSIQDILMPNDQSLLYIVTRDVIPNAPTTHLLITDTMLNLVSFKPFPTNQLPGFISSQFHNSVTAKILSNDDFIVGGTFYSHALYQGIQLDIGFSIFDTSMVYRPMKLLGKMDTADNGGFRQCIDFKSEDSIYFAGTQRIISAPYPNDVSWIYTGLLNSNLDLSYEHWYGGDAHYMVMSIVTAQDGGYYISAMRYDQSTSLNLYDLSVIKLNNEGLITGSHNVIPDAQTLEIYPNPSSDYICIYSSSNGLLQFFSLSGQLIDQFELQNGLNCLDIVAIPSGFYISKLVLNNKKTSLTKFVKK